MTPKEKAEHLFDQYYLTAEYIEWTNPETEKKAEKYNKDLGHDVLKFWHELAKKSAMIAVDEILAALESQSVFEQNGYWKEVKREIENL